jgi:D-alanyl-D-alanine endopeptidase (penicillin-binding protein 7)
MSSKSARRIAIRVATLCTAVGLVLGGGDVFAAQQKRQAKAKRPDMVKVAKKPGVRKVSLRRHGDEEAWPGGNPGLRSASALVLDQRSGEVLFEKNAAAIVPIASITKLMTAMVALDVAPDLQEVLTIGDEDVDTLKNSSSRLRVGTTLTREDAMLLALMSSENRAAYTLSRHYPGGRAAFVAAMNRKAAELGMTQTRFVDPTGLSSENVSTAHDLAKMVAAAHNYPLIREFSTTNRAVVEVGRRQLGYHNTNALVASPGWEIGLSKTGFIQEAGKCLVMQAWVSGRPVVMVLLDSNGRMTRVGDANRLKRWMENGVVATRKMSVPS